MYLIISGILQLIIVLFLVKSIDNLRKRIAYLEVIQEALGQKIKKYESKLENDRKEGN